MVMTNPVSKNAKSALNERATDNKPRRKSHSALFAAFMGASLALFPVATAAYVNPLGSQVTTPAAPVNTNTAPISADIQ